MASCAPSPLVVRRRRSAALTSACALAFLSLSISAAPAQAQAQPATDTSAVARDLFDRGKAKWAAGEFAEAAVLLAASNQQLPRAGTAMLLADAYERSGRLRAALETFRQASQLARDSGNPELEHRANTREAALRPRMSQLEIRVAQPAPSGLLVTLNGVELPATQLNTLLYLDPGNYVIEARARGQEPVRHQVALANDGLHALGTRVVPIHFAGASSNDETERREPAPGDMTRQERDELALWIGGAGSALVLASVVSLVFALGKNGASKDRCGIEGGTLVDDDNLCTSRGADLRGQARTFAHVATATGIIGLGGLGAGLTLHFTGPRESGPESAWVSWTASF
jgi:hypothetical protein